MCHPLLCVHVVVCNFAVYVRMQWALIYYNTYSSEVCSLDIIWPNREITIFKPHEPFLLSGIQ